MSRAPRQWLSRAFHRAWKPALAALLLAAPLLFGLGNAFLATPWGRAFVAAKISGRIGLETVLDGASWSPWRGVTLRGLAVFQPEPLRGAVKEPLLEIETLRVVPDWPALLRGRPGVREVEVVRPRLTVAVEMLPHLVQPFEEPAGPPLLAGGDAPSAAAAGESAEDGTPPAPADSASAGKAAPPASAAAAAPQNAPTRWLRCRGAAGRLCSAASGRDWLAVDGMDLELPFAGAPATGGLSLRGLEIFGNPSSAGIQKEIVWRSPLLTIVPGPLDLGPLELHCGGQVALAPGLPLSAAVEMPRQQAGMEAVFQGISLNSPAAGGAARFAGFLLAPGSWHGELMLSAATPELGHGGNVFAFDRGLCVATLRGGALSCPDVRLVGEEFSLLGNGTLFADGRLGAVLRVAAPPETARGLAEALLPGLGAGSHVMPLSSEQRATLDISFTGTLAEPMVRVGDDAPFRPFTMFSPPPPP